MIYKGATVLKAFKGNHKPVNIYKGNIKVAGWENQAKTGQSISFDNTYDDVAEVTATGNSSRTTTVTGKNLFDKEMAYLTMVAEATNLGKYVPNKVSYGSRDDVVKCHSLSFYWSGGTPDTEFYFSPYTFKPNTQYTIQFDLMYDEGVNRREQYFRIWYTDGTESHPAIYGSSDATKTWTHYVVTSAAGKTIQQFGWLYYSQSYFYLDLNSWQVEEGTAATAHEAFVPTAPTFLHPAYLDGVSGNLISRTQNSEKTSSVSLACQGISTYVPPGTPASKISQLHKVNGVYDSYNVTTGEFTQRIAVKIYNGTEQWYTVTSSSPYVYYVVPPQGRKLGYQMSLCSHFINKNQAFNRIVANMFYYSDHSTVDRIYFNTGPMFTTAAQFAAWVAAQYAAGTPLTLWMILPEPIVSYKTLEEVKTYYPNTVIEQDGIVKADLSVTAKITA